MAEGIYEHDTDQKNGTHSNLALSGELELPYRMNGDHKQVAVTESTKNGLSDSNMSRRSVASHAAERPSCRIVWLTRLRHANCTVADETGGVEKSTGCDASVYKPASDSVRFEKPEIE